LASLGHPYKFQRVSHLGSVTARHSCSGRQPNFAALNSGCHLYSAGRPSRWALAHVLVTFVSKFYISATKHVSRCAELIDVIFPFHAKFFVATYLSLVDLLDCKLVHQAMLSDVQTDRGRPVLLLLSALPVSLILLMKSFKVLRFHCLEGNSFIILSTPNPFSTRNARINTLSSLVNGHIFIFTSITSVMMSRIILITDEYLTAQLVLSSYLSVHCKY